ncbi:MAG: cysteine desulfurase [Acidobacteriota bacterium]|nr:cysteine desulfurase [Acidobacteriota bacterium]
MTTQIAALDIEKVRSDFPILQRQVNGKPLVYLDSAATAQKPAVVIDAIADYYRRINANVHRGVHRLSQDATEAFEGARGKIRKFLNARSDKEIIFTGGTTDGINLVSQSYARSVLTADDEVLITHLEHHSNIVPWQIVCEQTGATLKVIPIDDKGQLEMSALDELLTPQTRIVALNHISNALGTINPVKEITARAREVDAVVVIDGAQAAPHMAIDVQDIDCDFYAISAHKMYGPTGIGALYGKEALLKNMPPYRGGGDMILMVSFDKTIYNDLPYKFEAGTPNIAGAVGMGAAVDYLTDLGLDAVAAYEHELLAYGTKALSELPGLRMIGTADNKAGVLGFVLDYAHPHDVGTILDQMGIAVRTGHHCAQPVMDRYDVAATIRASLGVYNTREDIDVLVAGISKVHEVFG